MKRYFILFSFIFLLISCNRKQGYEVISQEITPDSTFALLTIVEYDQYSQAIETIIQSDSIIRIEKNWQTDKPIKVERLSAPYILHRLTPLLSQNFKRSNNYYEEREPNNHFVNLTIDTRLGDKIEVSFRNCRSKELGSLVEIINEFLPVGQQIKVTGSFITDNFIEQGSADSWKQLRLLTRSNSKNFDLRSFDRNSLFRIDSTNLGKYINKEHGFKSSYIISIKSNRGKFFPCIIYGEQYESDDLYSFLALGMIDSTFSDSGDLEFISSFGSDFGVNYESYSILADSILNILSFNTYDCEEFPEAISQLNLSEKFILTNAGKIKLLQRDTTNLINCKQ
jgi:hypothetical protein